MRGYKNDILPQRSRVCAPKAWDELGGAIGSRFGYIDFLIYDGNKSTAVEQILNQKQATGGIYLHYFAIEKPKRARRLT